MYQKNPQGWSKHLDFMLLDLVCLQCSFLIAYTIRNGGSIPYLNEHYRNLALALVWIDLGVLIFFTTLKNVLKRGYYQEFTKTLKHVILVFMLAILFLFYSKRGEVFSRLTLSGMAILYLALTYVVRIFWKKYLILTRANSDSRSLLIITTKDMLKTVLHNILSYNYQMFRVAGVAVLDEHMIGTVMEGGVEVVADKDSVVEYACREWIDEVFFNLPSSEPYPDQLMNQFTEMGIVVHMKMAKSSNLIGEKKFVERLGCYTVLTTSINYATAGQLFVKRAMDILGGLVGCIITGILCIILGPLIYIHSPGPIFFSQTRVGKNGKKFKLYKFRSMYMDAEERKKELMKQNRVKDGMMFKLEWDPRIIGSKITKDGTMKKGIGNLIRDFSLDEFPQFFNVLKGDMSLVGTRPPTVDEWEKYDLHHRARLAAKPGITGMWQVSGRSNITDFEDVVKLDTKYIAEWTMGLDIRILLKTVLVVFKKDGAM